MSSRAPSWSPTARGSGGGEGLQARLRRITGLRAGEARFAAPAFAVLLLTVAAHTMLETVRDALFLSQFQARDLNVVYVAVAGLSIVTAYLGARATAAIGRRRALVYGLALTSAGTAALYPLATTRGGAFALYLFSGAATAMLVPQFWLLAEDLVTIAQARRLFGAIGAGGVVGGILGGALAALLVRVLPVADLLVTTAALFLAAAVVVASVRAEPGTWGAPAPSPAPAAGLDHGGGRLLWRSPFLRRVAGLVASSASAVLVVDYVFKASAAAAMPHASLGFFFGRYYAVMNAASLLVQVFVAGRAVRWLGVTGAPAVMPALLLSASVATAVEGGFAFVLVLKMFDGALRYSLHRVATELLYMPVPTEPRQRAKSFIDAAVLRMAQALTAIVLYVLASRGLATTRVLATGAAVVCSVWLVLALTLRGAYLDLFRGALARGGLDPSPAIEDIDLTSAEALVEAMASTDPRTVMGAMEVLAEHGRTALIPALVLRHEDPSVLERALAILGRTKRSDWIPLALRLLTGEDERVAAAALHALVKAGRGDALEAAAVDGRPRLRACVALLSAGRGTTPLASHPAIRQVLECPGEEGRLLRTALVAAIAGAPEAPSGELLLELAARSDDDDDETVEELAEAIAASRDPRLVPACIARLARPGGREAMRGALVALGAPALSALELVLHDEGADPRLRLHAPRTIARFGSQRAADVLVAQLRHETHGVLRYKVIRAIGHLVAHHDVRVDRATFDAEASRTLVEHLRLLAIRFALRPRGGDGEASEGEPCATGPARDVLLGLLDDKLGQALERAFRLLSIGHPSEAIEAVHAAALSAEDADRARAGEFLDVLLGRRDERELRSLLRIVVDDARDEERIEQARAVVGGLVRTPAEAVTALLGENDDVLVALAVRHARQTRDGTVRGALASAMRSRAIEATSEILFGEPFDRVGGQAWRTARRPI